MQLNEKRKKLRELWLDRRPETKRTGNDVLIFYGWLEKNCPELLTRGQGDPYQHLKSDLSGLWENE
jgi:hypothetical protein